MAKGKVKRIGIDIGGTNTKIGLVAKGKIEKKRVIPTEKEPKSAILSLVSAIREIASQEEIATVGIGCAGLIDHKKGIVRTPPNLPKWHNFPLKRELEKRLKIPVFVGNDVNACALGEYYYGLGKGKRNIFVLTIGTGVGGGIISDGELILGENFAAGEFGHTLIFPEGKRCQCGNRGCLEAYIGEKGIRQMAKILFGKEFSPEEISFWAKRKDKRAIEIIEKVGYYLGLALVNVIHLFDPEIIIIGGGISGFGRTLLEATRKTIKTRIMKLPKRKLAIKISQLGSSAGILGATRFSEILSD
ncbi:MAG: ROK family protein [candidate division WOR-3 bacterium]